MFECLDCLWVKSEASSRVTLYLPPFSTWYKILFSGNSKHKGLAFRSIKTDFKIGLRRWHCSHNRHPWRPSSASKSHQHLLDKCLTPTTSSKCTVLYIKRARKKSMDHARIWHFIGCGYTAQLGRQRQLPIPWGYLQRCKGYWQFGNIKTISVTAERHARLKLKLQQKLDLLCKYTLPAM